MAIQKDTEYTGTIGNLIYYKWMDLYCIRTVPSRMPQTEASKRAAINFGKVSSRSKILRQYFQQFIAAPRDKDMQGRLKKALLESIHFKGTGSGEMASHPLNGFRFNNVLSVEQCLGVKLQISQQVDGSYRVQIPPLNPCMAIKAPPGTTRVQLEFKPLSFNFDQDQTFGAESVIINIPYTNSIQPVNQAETNMIANGTAMLIFVACVTYWNGDIRLALSGREPAEVVAVFGF